MLKKNLSEPSGSLFQGYLPDFVPLDDFPKTRYQGSKRRLLNPLQDIFARFKPTRAFDLYSGTASVSLLLKFMGWHVTANDYLLYNNTTARVLLDDSSKSFTLNYYKDALIELLEKAPISSDSLVAKHFFGIYFLDEENIQIDRFCQNIKKYPEVVRDLLIYCVGQALLMKRPYNLFHRANLTMRTRSVTRSFGNVVTWNKSIFEHAIKIASSILDLPSAPISAGHSVTSFNTLHLDDFESVPDLLYLDPPYLNNKGLGIDYCDFYHFLDGLCDYSLFEKYDPKYPHRPIAKKPTAWLTERSALNEFRRILEKWPKASIVLSYRDDGCPAFGEIEKVFQFYGRKFQSVDTRKFKYALSHKNETKELFLISIPD